MKIVTSYSTEEVRALEQEIQRLQLEKADLEAEVKRCRDKYGTLPEAAMVTSSSAPSIVKLRTIKAERNVDGRLLTSPQVATASYAKPTQASQSKAKVAVTQHRSDSGLDWSPSNGDDDEGRWSAFEEEETEVEFEVSRAIDSEQESAYDDTPCSCPSCTAIVKADDSLEKQSRLRDNSFYTTDPAGQVRLPIKTQLYYLHKAYSLAQGALWHALRDHWPQAQRRYYLEGPELVRFGHSELEGCFGNSRFPSQHNRMCSKPPDSILTQIFAVIDLRNVICHPSPHATADIDRLMQRAQDLAVTLLDETRAMRVRRLRDEVQKVATRELNDITALEPLSWLPDARPWALHHQIYFEAVLTDLSRSERRDSADSVKHGPAAVRATRSWGMRCSSPGEDDPRYVAVMARKAEYVREAGDVEHANGCAVSSAPRWDGAW